MMSILEQTQKLAQNSVYSLLNKTYPSSIELPSDSGHSDNSLQDLKQNVIELDRLTARMSFLVKELKNLVERS